MFHSSVSDLAGKWTKPPMTLQPHNLTTSQPHNLTTSQPHNLTTSQPHNLTTSHMEHMEHNANDLRVLRIQIYQSRNNRGLNSARSQANFRNALQWLEGKLQTRKLGS
jgi:hypothetical protein